MRSIGETIQARPTATKALDPRGTRGSRSRPWKRRARFGSRRASSRTAALRPLTQSRSNAVSHSATSTPNDARTISTSGGYPVNLARGFLIELVDVDPPDALRDPVGQRAERAGVDRPREAA